jgi:hypothetical protein
MENLLYDPEFGHPGASRESSPHRMKSRFITHRFGLAATGITQEWPDKVKLR